MPLGKTTHIADANAGCRVADEARVVVFHQSRALRLALGGDRERRLARGEVNTGRRSNRGGWLSALVYSTDERGAVIDSSDRQQ